MNQVFFRMFTFLIIFLFASTSQLHSDFQSIDLYDPKDEQIVESITVSIENLSKNHSFNQDYILYNLLTKKGSLFSQTDFDYDLKTLSKEYDRVESNIDLQQGNVSIYLKIWQKPMIHSIVWVKNSQISTEVLQKELNIRPHTLFNQEEFNYSINKVKEYYINKGFFNSEVSYKVIPDSHENEVDIEIKINEGLSKVISKIICTGVSEEEKDFILSFIQTKHHSFFKSWANGQGVLDKEILEQDKVIIVNHLQNQGYADAIVDITVQEDSSHNLEIHVNVIKGEEYHFGMINIQGNTIFEQLQIENVMLMNNETIFSHNKLIAGIQNIKNLYGKEGYIELDINYTLHLSPDEPIYNLDIELQEGEQFLVGPIHIIGNVVTQNNVILRQSLLIPGQVFDSRFITETQQRLEAMNYFKSVNVYSVKRPYDQELKRHYHDVFIEVQEKSTGNFSFFEGLDTMNYICGGIGLSEKNFNHQGLIFWRKGGHSFRGAGEHANLKIQFSKKQKVYSFVWLDPYFKDTMWKLGFDTFYLNNGLYSDRYNIHVLGGSIFAKHPISKHCMFEICLRLRNTFSSMQNKLQKEVKNEDVNSGFISGLSTSLSYETRENLVNTSRGLSSSVECELGGIRSCKKTPSYSPFGKIQFLNTYYYPLWSKGTIKLRGDARFFIPFSSTSINKFSLNERFFLGGEFTLRGYKPFSIGQHVDKKTNISRGGLSSMLFSIEYLQKTFSVFDLFVFLDGGSLSEKTLSIPNFYISYGFGIRIDLGNKIPFVFGMAFPKNPKKENFVQRFFFSIGAQF